MSEVRRVLKPEGKYILIGGGGPEDHKWIGPLGRIVQMLVVSRFVNQNVGFFVSRASKEGLEMLAELMQAGQVTPVIDRRYAFSEAAEAIRYLESARARGKVVVRVAQNAS